MGLRREDVAELAGISVAWYIRLEQGQGVHPSRAALDAIARALRLEPAERTHLHRLARLDHGAERPTGDETGGGTGTGGLLGVAPSPALRRVVDSVARPAFVMDQYWDVVAHNALAAALFPSSRSGAGSSGTLGRNVVRYVLTSAWRTQVRGWEGHARAAVAGLRGSLAPVFADAPTDARAAALVEALTRESNDFRAWWAEHGVWVGERPVALVQHHPLAGLLELEATLLDVRGDAGLTLVIFAPCNAETAAALARLCDA